MVDFSNYLARETLKDGTEVTVRAIRPDDGPAILEAFRALDAESIYRRFFSPKKELSDAELKQLTDVDFQSVMALVVTVLEGRRSRFSWAVGVSPRREATTRKAPSLLSSPRALNVAAASQASCFGISRASAKRPAYCGWKRRSLLTIRPC